MNTSESTIFELYEEEASLTRLWNERQTRILETMPKYMRRVVLLAMIGFIFSVIIQSVTQVLSYIPFSELLSAEPPLIEAVKSLLQETLSAFEFRSFSLGGIISFVLSLFSNIVMWAFVIWSLTFIPFIAYNSYKIAQGSTYTTGTRPFKWVQLYASTLLPMAVFAIAWNSTPDRQGTIVIQVKSLEEVIILALGTIIVTVILFSISRFVPVSAISVRLSMFSFLIYSTLYFAYGQGYSVVSFSLLLGVMFYLMFASKPIEEMGKGLITYDLDENIVERLDSLEVRRNELRMVHDETQLAQHENEIMQEEAKARNKLEQSQMDQQLNRQLSDIQASKLELIQKMNRTQIDMLGQKIFMLNRMFEVTSKEFNTRLGQEFPKRLNEIKEEAKTLSPQELHSRMNELMMQMNPVLEVLPECLGELLNQLLEAANEL